MPAGGLLLQGLRRASVRALVGTVEASMREAPMVGRPLAAVATRQVRRNPVVLVGGYGTGPDIWSVWRRSLVRDGFDVHVFNVPGNALGDTWRDARALGGFVDEVRAATGAAKVDLIGYSKGGLIARTYTKLLGGGGNVNSVVTIASPNRGMDLGLQSRIGPIAWMTPEPVRQMYVGSDLVRALDDGVATPGVRETAIYAKLPDGMLFPTGAGAIQGARNIAIDEGLAMTALGVRFAPTHFGIVSSSNGAFEAMRSALVEGLR